MRVVLFDGKPPPASGEIRIEPARVVDGSVVQVGSLSGLGSQGRAVIFAPSAGEAAREAAAASVLQAEAALGGVPPLAVVEVRPGRLPGEQPRGWVRVDGTWLEVEVMVVATGDVFSRNGGVLESSAAADRTVAVVGLGSGGSVVASDLVRAGVGGFVLLDHDILEPHNVGRHACDLADVGRSKVAAMTDHLLRRNPAARVLARHLDVLDREDELEELLAPADVLVCATDSNRTRRIVNRIALETGKVAVFGRAYRRAAGGDVIVVRPGRGPCFECLFRGGQQEEVSSARSAQAPAYSDVPVVAEPGLALDIAPIAHMVSRVALQELVRGRAPVLASLDEDLASPLFMYANRREGQFAEWRPLGEGIKPFTPMRWYAAEARVDPVCPTCQLDAFLESLAAQAAM